MRVEWNGKFVPVGVVVLVGSIAVVEGLAGMSRDRQDPAAHADFERDSLAEDIHLAEEGSLEEDNHLVEVVLVGSSPG